MAAVLASLLVGGSAAGNACQRAQAAACSTTPTGGVAERTVDGGRYTMSVPPGLQGRARVLIDLHGNPSPLAEAEAAWRWFEDLRYIVAYPQRTSGSDAGVNWTWDQYGGDSQFLRAVIGDIEATYCVDRTHVHVFGNSFGGNMAQRLACDASELVASVAELGGGPPTRPFPGFTFAGSGVYGCDPQRPISIALFHGTADQNIPTSQAELSREEWSNRLGCTARATTRLSNGLWMQLTHCEGTAEVWWRQYTDTDHFTTPALYQSDIRHGVLAFFDRHPLD